MARTDNLNNYLTDVATAIKTKKGDSTPINAANFDTEIANLPSGGGGELPANISFGYSTETDFSFLQGYDFSERTDYNYMFYHCTNVATIPTFRMNQSTNTTITANRMFQECSNLTSVQKINIPKCKLAEYMFASCAKLKSVTITDLGSAYAGGASCSNMFANCSLLESVTFEDESIIIGTAGSMFSSCTSLVTLPYINKSTYLGSICLNCTSLENVPVLNMARCTSSYSHYNMFRNCPALTNTSLNNILASLATLGYKAGNKTLKFVGLDQTQATTCTTLSNWAALSADGWTTGY